MIFSKLFTMNKYFYLLAAGLLLFCTGRAQINKGDLLLGGALSFQQQNSDPIIPNQDKATIIGVIPSFGKAVRENLVVGINFSFVYARYREANGSPPLYTARGANYRLSFFVRQYKDLGNNFSLFLEGDLGPGYGWGKSGYDGSNPLTVDNRSYGIYAGLSGGVAYRLTHRWMLETGFQNLAYANYGQSKYEGTGIAAPWKTDNFALGTSLGQPLNSFIIGCRYILN